ncbi:MAG: class I SAM-dependent methyltransferase [Aureispira sp.]
MDKKQEQIRAVYEEMATAYDARIDTKPYNAYYDRPNTLALLGEVTGLAVLDAGCGPGKYAEVLLAKGATVTAFDYSPKMVDLAKARNGAKGTFFVHNLAEPLEQLEAASFDKIVCALALHYLEDWTVPLQEFARLLKPQGELVLSLGHPFSDYKWTTSDNYFEVEAISNYWKSFDLTVHSYRRSLQDSLQPLLANGFYIDALLEYQPIPTFEAIDPINYKRLQQFPDFMGIRAILR